MKPLTADGQYYVRPPSLSFKEIHNTKTHIEYKVQTFRTPKDKNNSDNFLEQMTDSFIFCDEFMKIKMPKKSHMIKQNGKKRYAYAFGMFPNPKNGKAAYLDGCILGALGLKRQDTNADVVCFVTPDINIDDRNRLKVVFDKVIRVPYISPFDMPGTGKLKNIKMDPNIFKNCPNYTAEHPYSHVFFKLHIFNPDLFPYDKVCFVDSDLVPLNFYDSLFSLNTPAGWVEYRKKDPYKQAYVWDRCDYLKHGQRIPKAITDIDKPTGADVNAGLMVISPNKKEYNDMIKELTSPIETWMGTNKKHKGFYHFDFDVPGGQQFIPNSYCFPEQNYLTKRYSGKWTFIEFAFQSWTLDPCNSFGIHMAAFNPKPWFKQPAGLNFVSKTKPVDYIFEDIQNGKARIKSIPTVLAEQDNHLTFENINYSYEIFNDVIIWGLVNYPKLSQFFVQNTEIHGTKRTTDQDNFSPLLKGTQFKTFKTIKENDSAYNKLSLSQRYIFHLLKNNKKYAKLIQNNYLSVCENKKIDRYGLNSYNPKMIEYPNHSTNNRGGLLLTKKKKRKKKKKTL